MAERATGNTIGKVVALPLPSGMVVRVRRPSVFSLITSGGFPAELTQVVFDMVTNPVKPEEMIRDPERLRQLSTLIDAYVPHVLVSPHVGPMSSNSLDEDGVVTGTVALVDLADMDKLHLFMFGQGLIAGPATEGGAVSPALTSFRDGAASADAGRGVEEVRATPLEAAGAGPA
jgi:hypothetical protein